jgi:D-glycero-D-manno-heptose 1,7-bisphosphate phosphatase
VGEAIRLLNQNGLPVAVLTNQRGVALGLYDQARLEEIHAVLRNELRREGAHLDGIYVCPHDEGRCDCRKPKTGLIRQAFEDFPFATLENSVLIGDSLPDILAGRSFGLRTIFLEGDPGNQKAGAREAARLADWQAPDLLAAVRRLLAEW